MKIGILRADSVLPQFQARHGDYPAMIETVLGRAAQQVDVAVTFFTYDVEQGHYPARIDDCDGYVITGSKKSAYDDEPWIRKLGTYIQALHAARARVVGLCFGHQLIAHFLGGRAEVAAVGWGVGIHISKVVNHAWFMEAGLDTYSLLTSHQDQVVVLPGGAELIATSDFCRNDMFCLGDHILALQGHPEFNRDYARDLMTHREDILGPEIYKAGIASLDRPLSREMVARWIVHFLKPG